MFNPIIFSLFNFSDLMELRTFIKVFAVEES